MTKEEAAKLIGCNPEDDLETISACYQARWDEASKAEREDLESALNILLPRGSIVGKESKPEIVPPEVLKEREVISREPEISSKNKDVTNENWKNWEFGGLSIILALVIALLLFDKCCSDVTDAGTEMVDDASDTVMEKEVIDEEEDTFAGFCPNWETQEVAKKAVQEFVMKVGKELTTLANKENSNKVRLQAKREFDNYFVDPEKNIIEIYTGLESRKVKDIVVEDYSSQYLSGTSGISYEIEWFAKTAIESLSDIKKDEYGKWYLEFPFSQTYRKTKFRSNVRIYMDLTEKKAGAVIDTTGTAFQDPKTGEYRRGCAIKLTGITVTRIDSLDEDFKN